MFRKDKLLLLAERGRFLITSDTDEVFEGILLEWDDGHIVIVDVASISAKGDRLKVDGEIWIPRNRVKYMQSIKA